MGLSDDLERFVLEGDYEGAKNKICVEASNEAIDADGMNLIAKIFDVGLRTAFTSEQITSCSEILCHIVRNMSGKEALISLLEQVEIVDLENKLHLVLEPLRIAMDKVPQQWHKNLKWILEVTTKRLRLINVPAQIKQESKRLTPGALKKLETGSGVLKTGIYEPIQGFLNFYEYCVSYCLTNFNTTDSESLVKRDSCTKILRDHILRLLGHPLIYCPFRYPQDEAEDRLSRGRDKPAEESKETNAMGIAMSVANLLNKLETSVSDYHNWLEKKISDQEQSGFREKCNESSGVEKQADEPENCVVDYLSLGCYYYLVYGKNLSGSHRKSPISPVREVTMGLFLISELLEDDNVEVQVKALSFGQSLLNQLCPRLPFHRLVPEFLDTNIHLDFFRKLSHVLMYSDHHEVRRLGAFVFKSYLWSFNAPGRFNFLKSILNSDVPDTLIGFVITQIKEFVRQAIEKIAGSTVVNCMGQEEPLIADMEIYFTGKHLQALVELCMKFKSVSGPVIDLMSSDSQVLSTLNLIRFLLIRDGKNDRSGVGSLLSGMNRDFLKTVRTSLDLNVMQTKGRLRELEDPEFLEWESKSKGNNNKFDTSINDPSGAKLTNPNELSVQEQTETCKKALSKMDLLECVLAHTNECLDSVDRKTAST